MSLLGDVKQAFKNKYYLHSGFNRFVYEQKTGRSIDIVAGITDLFLKVNGIPALANTSVKSVKTVYEYVISIKENNFNKKLRRFLEKTGTTMDSERIKFLQKIDQQKKDFFERILLLIESIEDERKVDIYGNVCVALIREQIDMDEFNRLAHLITNNLSVDLFNLYERSKKYPSKPSVEEAKETLKKSKGADAFDLRYKGLAGSTTGGPSPLAIILLEYGF